MKVFIGCSSFENVNEKYKKVACEVAGILSTEYDLVVGATNKGLMKDVMDTYLKTNKVIEAIAIELYKKDLEQLDNKCNVLLYDELNEQLDKFASCDLIVFLPGGYGTLNEIAHMLNKKANNLIKSEIVFINKHGFFDELISYLNKLYDEKLTTSKGLFKVIENLDDLNSLTK